MKDYLIVYGHNVRRGGSCYKETEIDCNELVKYMPIIKKIHDTLNKTENCIKQRLKRGKEVLRKEIGDE